MTEERNWHKIENRLDRIEAIVEANSQQIEANSQQIEKNTTALIDMRLAVSSPIETSNQFQRNFEVIVSEIQEIKQEIRDIKQESQDIQRDIRGLQVENRRILDHLFGQQGN